MKLTSLKKLALKSAVATAVLGAMMATAHAGVSFQTKGGAEAEVYGFVRGDAVYKIYGTDTGIWNDVENAPLNDKRDVDLNTTMSTTRLGVNFNAPVEGKKVGGKIEGDFLGNGEGSRAFRIRHAYMTYENWLLGQTWSTFNDMNTFADIIDFNPIAGQGAHRVQMVRYETALNPTVKVAGAIEKNAHYDQLPNFVGRVQFTPNSQTYLSGRAFVTQAHVDTITRGTGASAVTSNVNADKEVSWGVGVSGSYKITDTVKLLGEYNHIKGNSQYMEKDNFAYQVTADNKKLVLNEYDTFLVGTEVKVTPKITTNLALGYVKHKAGEYAQLAPTANKNIKQGFVNVQYKPVKPITLGVEYVHGERETFGKEKGKDSRVGVMASYAF